MCLTPSPPQPSTLNPSQAVQIALPRAEQPQLCQPAPESILLDYVFLIPHAETARRSAAPATAMKDLTTGSIPRHILRLALPMAAGMIFQTMYYMVDLFFVAKLGDALGNTVPSMISSAARLLTYGLPALWLSSGAGFEIRHIWYLAVAAATGQAALSVWMLRAALPKRDLAAAPAVSMNAS